MLSVGVVGARRARQGIGEHVARFFARQGAEVRAIAGTTPESVAAAQDTLVRDHGVRARGYVGVEALLDAERDLDVLAICSPIAAHEEALEMAARRGLHCLCDKPLLGYAPGRDAGAAARALARRFAAAGRHLATITQWPQTLPVYQQIFPEVLFPRARRFAMRLSPTTRGPQMVLDSLPHPLSLLRAIAGGPGAVRDPAVTFESDEAATVRFAYEHARGRIDATVTLRRTAEQPRPASYAIDGLEAHREVRPGPGYAQELAARCGARLPLEDPLGLLVRDFVARAERGAPPDEEGLAADAAGLDAIMAATSEPHASMVVKEVS